MIICPICEREIINSNCNNKYCCIDTIDFENKCCVFKNYIIGEFVYKLLRIGIDIFEFENIKYKSNFCEVNKNACKWKII